MSSLSETVTSTPLGNTPILDIRSSIQIELLRDAPLKNEEIVQLASYICQAENIHPFIEHIITLRNRYDMSVDIRPLEIEILSLREQFPPRSLRNFYIALGDVGYHGLLMKVITLYQYDVSANVYLINLENAFGVQPDDKFIQDTLDIIEKSDMDGPGISSVIHLLKQKLHRISPYAPIPTYIQEFDIIVNQLPHLQERPVTEEMPTEILADYIAERIDDMGQYLEVPEGSTAKDVLINMVESMSPEELDELILKFSVDPEEVREIRLNRDVFRVYGPNNPYPDTDFSNLYDEETGELDVNLIFGGARMFTDKSQEIDDETGVPLDDWFTGYCMQCSLRIRSYHHAVREPGIYGGWSGCFCSWNCVRNSIRDAKSNFEAEGDSADADPDRYNLFILRMALTSEIENDMLTFGISDRDYEEDEGTIEGEIRSDQINQDAVELLKLNLANLNISQGGLPPVPSYNSYQ